MKKALIFLAAFATLSIVSQTTKTANHNKALQELIEEYPYKEEKKPLEKEPPILNETFYKELHKKSSLSMPTEPLKLKEWLEKQPSLPIYIQKMIKDYNYTGPFENLVIEGTATNENVKNLLKLGSTTLEELSNFSTQLKLGTKITLTLSHLLTTLKKPKTKEKALKILNKNLVRENTPEEIFCQKLSKKSNYLKNFDFTNSQEVLSIFKKLAEATKEYDPTLNKIPYPIKAIFEEKKYFNAFSDLIINDSIIKFKKIVLRPGILAQTLNKFYTYLELTPPLMTLDAINNPTPTTIEQIFTKNKKRDKENFKKNVLKKSGYINVLCDNNEKNVVKAFRAEIEDFKVNRKLSPPKTTLGILDRNYYCVFAQLIDSSATPESLDRLLQPLSFNELERLLAFAKYIDLDEKLCETISTQIDSKKIDTTDQRLSIDNLFLASSLLQHESYNHTIKKTPEIKDPAKQLSLYKKYIEIHKAQPEKNLELQKRVFICFEILCKENEEFKNTLDAMVQKIFPRITLKKNICCEVLSNPSLQDPSQFNNDQLLNDSIKSLLKNILSSHYKLFDEKFITQIRANLTNELDTYIKDYEKDAGSETEPITINKKAFLDIMASPNNTPAIKRILRPLDDQSLHTLLWFLEFKVSVIQIQEIIGNECIRRCLNKFIENNDYFETEEGKDHLKILDSHPSPSNFFFPAQKPKFTKTYSDDNELAHVSLQPNNASFLVRVIKTNGEYIHRNPSTNKPLGASIDLQDNFIKAMQKKQSETIIEKKQNFIEKVIVSPDQKLLLVQEKESFNGCSDRYRRKGNFYRILIFDAEKGTFLDSLENESNITALAFSPDSKTVCFSDNSQFNFIKLSSTDKETWFEENVESHNLPTQGSIAPLKDYTITSLTLSPDGKQLLIGTTRSKTFLYDTSNKSFKTIPYKYGLQITAAAFIDNNTLVAGSTHGNVFFIDIASLTGLNQHNSFLSISKPFNHNHSITHLAISPDKKQFLAATNYGKIKILDIKTLRIVREFIDTEKKPNDTVGIGFGFSSTDKKDNFIITATQEKLSIWRDAGMVPATLKKSLLLTILEQIRLNSKTQNIHGLSYATYTSINEKNYENLYIAILSSLPQNAIDFYTKGKILDPKSLMLKIQREAQEAPIRIKKRPKKKETIEKPEENPGEINMEISEKKTVEKPKKKEVEQPTQLLDGLTKDELDDLNNSISLI